MARDVVEACIYINDHPDYWEIEGESITDYLSTTGFDVKRAWHQEEGSYGHDKDNISRSFLMFVNLKTNDPRYPSVCWDVGYGHRKNVVIYALGNKEAYPEKISKSVRYIMNENEFLYFIKKILFVGLNDLKEEIEKAKKEGKHMDIRDVSIGAFIAWEKIFEKSRGEIENEKDVEKEKRHFNNKRRE